MNDIANRTKAALGWIENNNRKILILLLLLFIFVLTLSFLFKMQNSYQITAAGIQNTVELILLTGIPVLIWLLVLVTKLFKHKLINVIIRIAFSVIMIIYFPYYLFFALMGTGIERIDKEIFINKENENIKIEAMRFDAGATDGGGRGKIVKVHYIFPLLRKVEDIDTNKIDRSKWIRVDRNTYYGQK